MNELIRDDFVNQLEENFIKSKKWESVDVQFDQMDSTLGEGVGVMLPAVTGETRNDFRLYHPVGLKVLKGDLYVKSKKVNFRYFNVLALALNF